MDRSAILRGDGTALIPLTRSLFAVVDEEWAWLAKWLWHAVPSGKKEKEWYAGRMPGWIRDKRIMIWMHRIILGLQDPETGTSLVEHTIEADHISGDGLDNRRANLRRATRSQNAANRSLRPRTKTGYRGVSRSGNRFYARLMSQGTQHYLGMYSTAIEAARAYDAAAHAHHGAFATPNFPNEA